LADRTAPPATARTRQRRIAAAHAGPQAAGDLPAAAREPADQAPARRIGSLIPGHGLSTVTIAWLAVGLAPAGSLGLFVGLAVAAYTLPAAIGALTLGALLHGRP